MKLPSSTAQSELAADATKTPPRRPADALPPTPTRTRFVEVRAAAARNLPRMDAFGSCDAFCRLSLCGDMRETSVRRGIEDEGGDGGLPAS